MITRPGCGLSMFLAVLLVGLPAFAFDDPLTSTSIRDAYMLGIRKDFKLRKSRKTAFCCNPVAAVAAPLFVISSRFQDRQRNVTEPSIGWRIGIPVRWDSRYADFSSKYQRA
jgi:hypothetical protein